LSSAAGKRRLLRLSAQSSRVVAARIAQLAAAASLEANVQDERHLVSSRALLAPGTRLYVSHLPKQTWGATQSMCAAVRDVGFEPVPHVPVRLVESRDALESILGGLVQSSRPREVLLISGDYAQPAGPYATVVEVLATGALERHGIGAVSIAGHPEGHAKVSLEVIRAAELEKARICAQRGLAARFVTQFAFEPEPLLHWIGKLQSRNVHAEFFCGLAGPAKITTLMRYAMRCGVGPSIRALSARAGSMLNLVGDHGPERIVRALAHAHVDGKCRVDGVHIFGFGGYLGTARWLHAVATGDLQLTADGGFKLRS
jgi:methylenetetrahydrofolate reductase (NADPH)